MIKNKVVAGVLTAMMLCSPAAAFADTASAKEEVIYGNLDHSGKVEKVYAVNIFEVNEITDYGDYEEIKNLTTEDAIHMEKGKVTVTASETPFYYEGTLKSEDLPWDIDIEYVLDGVRYDGSEIAGKSGALEIHMDIDKGGDSFFYDNYALQITMMMDGNYCRNISAEGATVANVGSDKQIVYTVLPRKGADITVTADVMDFEMEEISINGIKLALDVDVDTSGFEGQTEKLENGTALIDEGVGQLQDGAVKLQDGGKALAEGVAVARDSVSADAWKSVMKANGLDIEELKAGNEQAVEELTDMLDNRLIGLLGSDIKESIQLLIKLSNGNNAALSAMETYLDTVNTEMEPLEEGAADLSEGASQLADGAGQLKSGTSQLREGTAGIDEKISSEIDKAKDGIMGSDEVRSFISSENTNVEAVQFVMRTEPIKVMEMPDGTSVPKIEKSFWQKLLDLFR